MSAERLSPFTVRLPLPPSKNALRGYGVRRSFPTPKYKAWLRETSTTIWLAMNEQHYPRPSPADAWWKVDGQVWLDAGSPADNQNYEEAIWDALSGAQVDRATGKIVKPGLFWVDDNHLVDHRWILAGFAYSTPYVHLTIDRCPPPAGHDLPALRPRRPRRCTS